MTYATLDQMQDMEFGVTGDNRLINGTHFERLIHRDDPSLYGWAARYDDANGDMIDWDRVSEEEASELGLK